MGERSTTGPPWTRTPEGVRLRVRVQPRSSRSRVAGVVGEVVRVQVGAPPAEGAANQELVRVLAAWLGVARGSVSIVQGKRSRDKLIEVVSDRPADLALRVEAVLAACVDNPVARG